jgi:alpha-N-arabinofuranosidase
MKKAGKFFDGLSLHHYTITHDWVKKGSATDFDEAEWFKTLQRTLEMETIITDHERVMDKYDPEKKVALIVDEWVNGSM